MNEERRYARIGKITTRSPFEMSRIITGENLWVERTPAEQAALKWYTLFDNRDVLPLPLAVEQARDIAHAKLKSKLPLHAGLGFCIFTPGELVVNLWDELNPLMLHATRYDLAHPHGILRSEIRAHNLHQRGVLHLEEARILAHEAEAWRTYLWSAKQTIDKKGYLANLYGNKR